MASTDTTSSEQDHKRTVDGSFLNKLKGLVERLRLDNANMKRALDLERAEVRTLKARHDAALRHLKTEWKRKEELLEKQLRIPKEKPEDNPTGTSKMVELKRLTTEIQSLKSANRGLQEKLKVAQAAECARAAELRAQCAKHTALEQAARRDARAQCRKLLEEIKSKDRVIAQLRREAARSAASQNDQAQRMECGITESSRKRGDQVKEKSNREDLKTDIQHRKETFYREAPSDEDSAVSSAPASLSPQPHSDMWSCGECRSASERAASAARECTRLADALRDARDQLELMEFRLLELEDAHPEKGARDNLTDSDSGCVSPGSRIKDSASPELKRMDSGYKSPHVPGSPCVQRRHITTPHDDFKEDFAKAQVLAEILDRNSDTSDSLRSNPVKDHLEQMILNAATAEDRSCLEQVLMLLYNYQALSSSVSEDECYQTKPRRICDLRCKTETEVTPHKTHKAVATVTPYQQKGYKSESLESLVEERKPNLLQESGIFEEVETESRSTQTEINESFECTELNTEIQRLNSIREKLERQGVKHRTLSAKDDSEGLECRCVKLGKKHKQYYERRLKFLEGKISIYEAAQDVKEAKLAQRLQKEFLLENRIQELEGQLADLQDKYDRLEEECCELEEIENDTRLHWQQLEMDYELCTAQLRDMTEQRECSRAQAERLMAELTKRESALKARENELLSRLEGLEKAVPALILWNVVRAVGAYVTPGGKRMIMSRMGPYGQRGVRHTPTPSNKALVPVSDIAVSTTRQLERQIVQLLAEKSEIELKAKNVKKSLEARVKQLEEELAITKRQVAVAESGAEVKRERIEEKIAELEEKIRIEKEEEKKPADHATGERIKELLQSEEELKARVSELERREAAYLEMLAQADDMWADMEGGYKRRILEAEGTEDQLRGLVKKLESERDQWRRWSEPLKKKLREVEESESGLRISLEKMERDARVLREQNGELVSECAKAEAEARKAEAAFKALDSKFKKEIENLRRMNKQLDEELISHKEVSRKTELAFLGDLDSARRELNRACKSNQELEVTNSELKEELQAKDASEGIHGSNVLGGIVGKQLALTQKALSQCKRKCDDKLKTLSHELSIKTEELEEIRSEAMRKLRTSRVDLIPDRTEYVDEGYSVYTAPNRSEHSRMHHSMSYIASNNQCSCPSLRSQLVGQLIEDLFERTHGVDEELTSLCEDLVSEKVDDVKAKITNYLLMAISKELIRSIGDADAKTETEEVLEHGDVKIMEEQLANAIESIVNCPSCALGTNAIVWSTDV